MARAAVAHNVERRKKVVIGYRWSIGRAIGLRRGGIASMHSHAGIANAAQDDRDTKRRARGMSAAMPRRELAAAAYRELEIRFSKDNPKETDALRAEHCALRAVVEELGIGVDLHHTRLLAIQTLAARLREPGR